MDEGPADEELETKLDEENIEASKESSFIVVHENEHGVHFATRVDAENAEAASAAVLAAHTDNTVVDTLPDHGESTHGLGGTVLVVTNLEEEP